MTPQQQKAHARMMRTLPVRTIKAFSGSHGPSENALSERRATEQHASFIVNRRFANIKAAAAALRVPADTLREWIKRDWARFE